MDFNSEVNPAAHVTRNIFAILEPITFPIEMSGDPFITASMETTSSQRDVPNPITIRPIKNSETFSFFPIATEAEIKISAPLTTSSSPKIKDVMLKSIFQSLMKFRKYLVQYN